MLSADIVRELRPFGMEALAHDRLLTPASGLRRRWANTASRPWPSTSGSGVTASSWPSTTSGIWDRGSRAFSMLRDGGMLIDVKSALDPARLERRIQYWSL